MVNCNYNFNLYIFFLLNIYYKFFLRNFFNGKILGLIIYFVIESEKNIFKCEVSLGMIEINN